MTFTPLPTIEEIQVSQVIQDRKSWVGLAVHGVDAKNTFFRICCPCGVSVTYPLNRVPEVTTKHPCDNPEHYSLRFTE